MQSNVQLMSIWLKGLQSQARLSAMGHALVWRDGTCCVIGESWGLGLFAREPNVHAPKMADYLGRQGEKNDELIWTSRFTCQKCDLFLKTGHEQVSIS